jgi:hypothetical protein
MLESPKCLLKVTAISVSCADSFLKYGTSFLKQLCVDFSFKIISVHGYVKIIKSGASGYNYQDPHFIYTQYLVSFYETTL